MPERQETAAKENYQQNCVCGRYDQARSQWDVIHRGRSWAGKLKGVKGENDAGTILRNIREYVDLLSAGTLDSAEGPEDV